MVREKIRKSIRRSNVAVLHPLDLPGNGGFLGTQGSISLLRQQPDAMADPGQALIRIVLAQNQAIFTAGGHHPVWLVAALCNQIIDESADVGGAPI